MKPKPVKKHPKRSPYWADGSRFPEIPTPQPTKGCNFVLGAKPDAETKRFRAEIERRTAILKRERAKYPPTLIRKGKRLVRNPKFTSSLSRLSRFAPR
jgi:hypothetical protein